MTVVNMGRAVKELMNCFQLGMSYITTHGTKEKVMSARMKIRFFSSFDEAKYPLNVSVQKTDVRRHRIANIPLPSEKNGSELDKMKTTKRMKLMTVNILAILAKLEVISILKTFE